MKTELEEAAEKYSENWEEITGLDYENVVPSEVNKLDFINGAKWQQEQNKNLYSEEDMIEFAWFLLKNIGQYSDDRLAHFEGKYLKQFKRNK